MQDAELVQFMKPEGYLRENVPYYMLFEMLPLPFEFKYFLQQIPTICVLHHDAA